MTAGGARRTRPPRSTGGEASRADPLLHELVEQQVARSPYDVAVQHGDRLTSYVELDQHASALAARLREVGVGPDVPVVLSLEPSTELIVALLGILKAGGCYVPVAADTPESRVRRVLASIRPPVAITTAPQVVRAAHDLGTVEVVAPDADPAVTVPASRARTDGANRAGTGPDNLAYVIHTSGSTGEPKGVMVPHGGIVNTLTWRQRRFPFVPTDRVLLTFSFVFDASIFEIFQPLMSGARIVIPARPLGGDPEATVAAVRRYAITVLGIVPTLLEPLLDAVDAADRDALRVVFCGGERLTEELAERFRRRFAAELVNVYGPTESSLEATAWSSRSGTPLSIGHPIDGVRTHVLDDRLRPVAGHRIGELTIAGAGLARGYWADPRATAQRFVPDPFSTAPGSRMYRTGDRCRLQPDGALECLGRTDDQVKLRGHRIELGEIEAALRSHDAVRDAAVVVDHGAPAGGALTAFVAGDGDRLTTAELRRFLGGRLPASMVPGRTVFVDALPRTASGKVDRRSLRPPGPPATPAPPITPATGGEVEALLRRLWRRVLGVPRVGDESDFFELGGSSVQAAILAHALEGTLGEFVYPIAVYDAPTVARLASYVRSNYPDAVARLWGSAELDGVTRPDSGVDSGVDSAAVRRLRRSVRRVGPAAPVVDEPLDPMVFVLCPPRSGSTLLRVVLGVHSAVFAPPEVQLLNFATLRDRARTLGTERDRFWLQGTVRALMELLDCDVDQAERVMADCEARDLSVAEFYRYLQTLAGQRLLVDKTPTYALDPETLRRAETTFRDPCYLHLLRDPGRAVASFEEAKLDVFFPAFMRRDPRLSRRQWAEAVWTVSHRNILDFLRDVPPDRQRAVRYEDLVRDPAGTLRGVTDFLGLPFEPAMTQPYAQDQRRLMTDPVRRLGRMLGDVKFHEHRDIGATASSVTPADALGGPTRRVAAQLGYRVLPPARHLVTLQAEGRQPALFLVHPATGSVSCYQPLATALGRHRPVHALRSDARGSGGLSLEELAAAYLEEVMARQPRGPYHLAGWSFGGLVAFEMARQLRSSRRRVAQLTLIGSHLPPVAPTPLGRDFMVRALREHLAASTPPGSAGVPVADLRDAHRAARTAGLIALEQGFDEFRVVMEGYERSYRHHVAIARAYRPGPTDLEVLLLDPADTSQDDPGSFPSWTTVAGAVDRRTVPGNHFTMLDAQHVATVVRQLLRPHRPIAAHGVDRHAKGGGS